jgi:hypothetical protein
VASILMNEYADSWAGLRIGVTVRTNHKECGDTRGRLYFTARNEVVLAYCHNCNEPGVSRVAPYYKAPSITASLPTYVRPPGTFAAGRPLEEHEYDLAWASIDLQKAAGVMFNEGTSRYVLPIYDTWDVHTQHGVGPILGSNNRASYLNQKPKYLLTTLDEFPGYSLYLSTKSNPLDTIALVEDQLSATALALAGNGKVGAYCLYGAKHNIEKVHEIQKNNPDTKKYIVWLDNDNDEVHEASRILTEYLLLLGNKVRRVTKFSDPKRVPMDHLIAELL